MTDDPKDDYCKICGNGNLHIFAHTAKCKVYIVDVSDVALLDEWQSMNHQIKFADFESDKTKFDYIFLNDVFEHLPDPLGTLKILKTKFTEGGRVFINTPRQF